MDELPSTPPEPERPIPDWAFVAIFFSPLAAMAIVAVIVQTHPNGVDPIIGLLVTAVSISCSVLCAARVGKQHGCAAQVLMFLAFNAFYLAIGYAGCEAMNIPRIH